MEEQPRQTLNMDEEQPRGYGTNDAGHKHGVDAVLRRKRRTLLLAAAFLLMLLIIIVLLGVIIHLVATRASSDDTDDHQKADYDRPLQRWRNKDTCPPPGDACPAGPLPVLVISLDGFRPDYLKFGVTPTLQDMMDCGVTTPYVRVSFPSKTFPNHYSIVTGLYPESSGIVDNKMYDPNLPGRKFRLGAPESFKTDWWNGEPVWQTVKNKGEVSAVYFWPGSEVPDRLPNHYKPYNKKTPYEERVSQVMDWLLMPVPLRPRYLSLYFEEPDSTGHKHGPWSKQVRDALSRVDNQLASLYSQLIQHNLLGCVDVIVTSDHGMAAMREDCENVALDDYVPGLGDNSTYVNGPVTRVRPDHDHTDVAALVERLDCAHPALRVWQRHELPARWHYQRSDRIEPIVATTDLGYGLSVRRSTFCLRGTHGWDVDLPDMRAIFVGHGPSFKVNYTAPAFENIQMYSLLQTMLQLPDIENNATKYSLDHVLRTATSNMAAVGAAPVLPSEKLEQKLANQCCGQLPLCSCTALRHWRLPGGLNTSSTLPLPVSDPADAVESAIDGSFVAAFRQSQTHSYNWIQYTIERDLGNNTLLARLPNTDSGCMFHPSGTALDCTTQNTSTGSLVITPTPSSFLQRMTQAMYPMHEAYRERVLPALRNRLAEYWLRYPIIVVLAGPAYLSEQQEMDRDEPVPSHFFYQLRMCGSRDCSEQEIVHKQWILPNKEKLRACEPVEKFVDFHEATLRDVERVSGLRLFSDKVISMPSSPHSSHARFISQLPEFRPPQQWTIVGTSG